MDMLLYLFFFFAGSLFIIKMIYVASVAVSIPVTEGALYVSTSKIRIDAFLNEIKLKPDDLLIDIGCGDGRVLRKTNKLYKNPCIGLDMNPLANIKARILSVGYKNVNILYENFFKFDLSQADVVFCYLFPDVMKKLSDKMKNELKKGAVVVSCNFELPGFTPDKILRPGNSLHNDPIYIYHIK